MGDPDTRLVSEALEGSEAAFSRILELHQAPVRGYLARFVRNPDAVDDLAQETFIDAYRSLATYRAHAPLRLWLLGIARNRALGWFREQERRGTKRMEAALSGWLVRQLREPTAHEEQRVSALKNCLQNLPDKSASLIRGFYYKGLSAAELARRDGKKEGAVFVTLTRIRQALRQCVESRLKAGEAM